MDIRKLQRAIVDGLEDVKAHDIVVFNTEHLSPLFERVIIASGTSNRQAKALASSVRDAVRSQGMPVLGMEGGDNGEWIIVDCGAAVAHIMQPAIRDYYRLEEIWGGKPVKLKLGSTAKGLVKASEGGAADDEAVEAPKPRQKPATAKKAAASAKKAATAKPAAAAKKAAPARKAAPAKSGSASKPAPGVKTAAKKAPAARKPGATQGSAAARKAAPAKRAAPARKAAPTRKTPARG